VSVHAGPSHLQPLFYKYLERVILGDGGHPVERGRADPGVGGAGVGQLGVGADSRLSGALSADQVVVVAQGVAPRVHVGALSVRFAGRPT